MSALGAAGDVTIGIFNTREKQYHSRRYQGDYEISALVGNVSRKEGEPYLHLHITIGNPVTGEVHAGHLHRRGPRRAPDFLHHQRHPGAVPPGVGR